MEWGLQARFAVADIVEEGTLVVANEDEAKQTIHGDRFVKPTGRVAVAENKHMYATSSSSMLRVNSTNSVG